MKLREYIQQEVRKQLTPGTLNEEKITPDNEKLAAIKSVLKSEGLDKLITLPKEFDEKGWNDFKASFKKFEPAVAKLIKQIDILCKIGVSSRPSGTGTTSQIHIVYTIVYVNSKKSSSEIINTFYIDAKNKINSDFF